MAERAALGREDAEMVVGAARADASGAKLERVVARLVERERAAAAEAALRRHAAEVLRGLEEGVREALVEARERGRGEGLVEGAVVGAREALARFEAAAGGVFGPGGIGGQVAVEVVRRELQNLVAGKARDWVEEAREAASGEGRQGEVQRG